MSDLIDLLWWMGVIFAIGLVGHNVIEIISRSKGDKETEK